MLLFSYNVNTNYSYYNIDTWTLLLVNTIIAGPFDEPQDLSVTVLGPRSIMLQWSEPATPNGIITGYTLTVSNVTNTSQVSLSGTDLTYCVDDLNEFTNYTFNVTSSTRIGEGPAAMTVAQTDEDGMCNTVGMVLFA